METQKEVQALLNWLKEHPYFTCKDVLEFYILQGYDIKLARIKTNHLLENTLIRRYGKYYTVSIMRW